MRNGRVRICGFGNLQRIIFQNQPCPPTAELRDTGILKFLDKLFIAFEIGVDLFCDGTRGRPTATGFHALPVKRMIPDLGRVVENAGSGSISRGFLDNLLETVFGQFGSFDQFVSVDNIGVVMFSVMKI